MASRSSTGRSDAGFVAVVFLAALLVAGLGVYALSRSGGSPVTTPAQAALAPHPAAHGTKAPRPQRKATPSRAPAAWTHPTPAGALAVIRRINALTLRSRYAAACALESPAYLRFDAQHFPHGGCIAATGAIMTAVREQGISFRLTGLRVVSFGGGRATLITDSVVAGRAISQPAYVVYRRGHWWLSGGADSGRNLGY